MSEIYSLVSIDKSCTQCQYVNAISYSREILENMIKNINPDHLTLAEFIIKENTSIYILRPLRNKIFIVETFGKYNNNKNNNKNNLYAFNKITTNLVVENVLLDIGEFNIEELRKLNIFRDDLSINVIDFDTYYEEGIMNA